MNVRPINLREANDFVEAFHRHNGRTSRNGGRFAIGLDADGVLVAVAIVGNPLSATFMDGYTAEVLRLCATDGQRNACSMLYGACWRAWRAMGGRKLITYTLQSESGASLRGAGWKVVAEAGTDKRGWSMKGNREWQPIYGQAKFRWEAGSDATPSGLGIILTDTQGSAETRNPGLGGATPLGLGKGKKL